MSYLTTEEFESIANTVDIFPVTSEELGDITQYSFDCGEASEYEAFLKEKAVDVLAVTKTFVMIHSETKELIGYFSLAADTVRLTLDEKEEGNLDGVDFMSLPALKLGKLAINKKLGKDSKRKGYGSFVLDIVDTFAYEMIENGVACRFVTVDADIEYDDSTPIFYEKNGFVINLSRKRRPSDRTISMRRDIFSE